MSIIVTVVMNQLFRLKSLIRKEKYPMLSSLKFKSNGSKKHKKIWQIHNFTRKLTKKGGF